MQRENSVTLKLRHRTLRTLHNYLIKLHKAFINITLSLLELQFFCFVKKYSKQIRVSIGSVYFTQRMSYRCFANGSFRNNYAR